MRAGRPAHRGGGPVTGPLAARLAGASYPELFLGPDTAALEAVLARASRDELTALAGDPEQPPAARFVAAEALAVLPEAPTAPPGPPGPPVPPGPPAAPGWPPAGLPPEALAEVYVAALRAGTTGAADPWGLPGEVGPLGSRVVALGEPVVRPLLAALTDSAPLRYAGGDAAGNGYRWRVKDQAAVLLAAIADAPIRVPPDPAERDLIIARLGRQLRERAG